MSRTEFTNLSVKLITLGLLVAGLVFFSAPEEAEVSAQTPAVRLAPQTNSPLRILSADFGPNDDGPQQRLNVVVKNIGKKPIRAFAIRQVEVTGGGQTDGVQLNHMTTKSSLLQPGGTQTVSSDVDGETVIISVDFIECNDGTVWGADVHKSKDRLEGQRAGAHAAIRYYSELLQSGGPEAVIKAVEVNGITVPDGSSQQWSDGFSSGVGVVNNRVLTARDAGGLPAIKKELQQPYDASEGRQ